MPKQLDTLSFNMYIVQYVQHVQRAGTPSPHINSVSSSNQNAYCVTN